jgi:hypothetical protein
VINKALFKKAVVTWFGPMAHKLGLPIIQISDGVFEIPSEKFVMRIRLDTGHRSGINVILRPITAGEFDENDPSIPQYGLGRFMQFYGEKVEKVFIFVGTEAEFLEQARLVAQAADRFVVPFFVGMDEIWKRLQPIFEKTLSKI